MTLGSLDTGDIVKVDKRGVRFFALVVQRTERDVELRPLDRRLSYRTASAREIVGIWKVTSATLRSHDQSDLLGMAVIA